MTSIIINLLKDAKSKSTCIKHPVSAIIETPKGQHVLGWNGPPEKGMAHTECYRKGLKSGDKMELCPTVHAERRAISLAAKKGVAIDGGTLYMDGWFPCADCVKSIIEAGITKLITPDEIYQNKDKHILVPKLQNQFYNFEMAERLLREAGIEIIIDSSIKPK